MLISPKSILTETSRMVVDQIYGHCGPATLTNKTHHLTINVSAQLHREFSESVCLLLNFTPRPQKPWEREEGLWERAEAWALLTPSFLLQKKSAGMKQLTLLYQIGGGVGEHVFSFVISFDKVVMFSLYINYKLACNLMNQRENVFIIFSLIMVLV